MKNFMRRNHADFLSRQFMGMALGEDIMRSLSNREALSHKAFRRPEIDQDDRSATHAAECGSREHLENMNS